jgi:hypothetical protein
MLKEQGDGAAYRASPIVKNTQRAFAKLGECQDPSLTSEEPDTVQENW